LVVRGESLGALNFYSRSAGAFTDGDREVPFALAAQAAVALANAEAYAASVALAAQLREALASRGVIDQAKGILMAQQRWGEHDAFERSRR
jgi:AmiR/NasT family two-component response regulator